MSPGPFLQAEWRLLAMASYPIDPQALQPFVPAGTELDLFDGHAHLSLVGFQFARARLMGLPIPFHQLFPEVNLRTYVRRRVGDEIRRGVVFIREIVPKRAVAWMAKRVYGEKFVRAEMGFEPRDVKNWEPVGGTVSYSWKMRKQYYDFRVTLSGAPAPPRAGSLEEFIVEHYYAYNVSPRGQGREFRVEHPPWRIWAVKHLEMTCDTVTSYGPQFAAALAGRPAAVFLAEGSEVKVYRGSALDR
jgi:uncharacterized protein